jgi:RNA polymerase sigma factor (sigma-70 family)
VAETALDDAGRLTTDPAAEFFRFQDAFSGYAPGQRRDRTSPCNTVSALSTACTTSLTERCERPTPRSLPDASRRSLGSESPQSKRPGQGVGFRLDRTAHVAGRVLTSAPPPTPARPAPGGGVCHVFWFGRHFVVVGGFLGDRDAFSSFYRANARTLLLFFTRRTFDAEAALDLTAETFAQAFASRGGFRGSSDEEAGAWLFAIARRQLARYFQAGAVSQDLVRRLGVVSPIASSGELERIEELADLGSLRAALRDQVGALEAGQRQALWLRVVDEQPYARVAQQLGISEQAARARVSRALRAIEGSLTAATAVAVGEDLA